MTELPATDPGQPDPVPEDKTQRISWDARRDEYRAVERVEAFMKARTKQEVIRRCVLAVDRLIAQGNVTEDDPIRKIMAL